MTHKTLAFHETRTDCFLSSYFKSDALAQGTGNKYNVAVTWHLYSRKIDQKKLVTVLFSVAINYYRTCFKKECNLCFSLAATSNSEDLNNCSGIT